VQLLDAYQGRTVLVTGDTGFKGSWLCLWLQSLGATVVGYALPPETAQDNFVTCGLTTEIEHIDGDVRDLAHLQSVFEAHQPSVAFHLAAQPLVIASYEDPIETFATNVMGTAHFMECVRQTASVAAAVNITTDKVYENLEQVAGYLETDRLGGHDPYSASKAASEIVTNSYRKAFLHSEGSARVATARAGNVIGGGDWADNRIFPDCVRALRAERPIVVRNPDAVRPWQHVLEPLCGYLMLAAKLLSDDGDRFQGGWNFGPDPTTTVPVGALVEHVITAWGSGHVETPPRPEGAVHEATLLTLDITKANSELDWYPALGLQELVRFSVDGYRVEGTQADFRAARLAQIAEYEACVAQRSS
jgi:CDP-glucose 4,6-dehydratase